MFHPHSSFQLKKGSNPFTGREFLCYDSNLTNLYDTLSDSARRFPGKTAIVDEQGEVSWIELLEKVDRLSVFLSSSCHIRKGDRIGLLMMNSIDFCVVFYAALKIGAVIVSLNTKMSAPQLQWSLGNATPRMLFSDNDWKSKIQEASLPDELEAVVFKSPEGGDLSSRPLYALDVILAEPSSETVDALSDIFMPALIMYTSGTTGEPKGALISHFNILQTALSYADILKLDENECTVISVPLFHITGLSCLMATFVYIGGKMVLLPKFNAEKTNELMRIHQATHIHAVPSIYTMLYDAQSDEEISSLRSAVCGGGPMAPENIRRYCSKNPGVSFHCAYGMTETAGAGTLTPVHYFDINKDSSSGIVAPNVEIHIIGDRGEELGPGETGEICFGGSVVIDHYWAHDPDTGFYNGWLKSGDIGKLDEDNFIYVLDRKKDMINRSGEKIFSIMVEKEIYNLPEVDMCAVFPVADSTHGEVPAVMVVLHDNAEITCEEILQYLKQRLGKHELPKYIEITDHIPLSPNNKIMKYLLRKDFEARHKLK